MRHLIILTLPVILAISVAACSQNGDEDSSNGIISSTLKNMERESLPGAKLTRRKCGSCHYLDRNISKVGPSLKGVVGRAPTISGVPFERWDEQSLNQWLKDPAGIKPNTLMLIPGIKSAKERSAIIEYLKQL